MSIKKAPIQESKTILKQAAIDIMDSMGDAMVTMPEATLIEDTMETVL